MSENPEVQEVPPTEPDQFEEDVPQVEFLEPNFEAEETNKKGGDA